MLHHLKINVQEKLWLFWLPSSISDEVLTDIFGKHAGSIYNEGLVDCTSEEAFHIILQHLKKVWNKYETPFAFSSGPQFHAFFTRYQADVVKYHNEKRLQRSSWAWFSTC